MVWDTAVRFFLLPLRVSGAGIFLIASLESYCCLLCALPALPLPGFKALVQQARDSETRPLRHFAASLRRSLSASGCQRKRRGLKKQRCRMPGCHRGSCEELHSKATAAALLARGRLLQRVRAP